MKPETPAILVAHESEVIRAVTQRLLLEAGFSAELVQSGPALLAALDPPKAALVLDVALPGALAFELVTEVRRLSALTRILLVASVYNRTGYKRRPTSLYGADDYIEQHHLPDLLIPKLQRLVPCAAQQPLDSQPPRSPRPPRPIDFRTASSIAEAGQARLDPSGKEANEHGAHSAGALTTEGEGRQVYFERAKRLARLIVSDIALYNGDALDQERLDHLPELEARLRADLEEGRILFDLRIPEEIRRTRDFIGEALAEICAQRRTQRGSHGT